jgi:hypothetical protein
MTPEMLRNEPQHLAAPQLLPRTQVSTRDADLGCLEAGIWSEAPSTQTEVLPEWCFIDFTGNRSLGYVLRFPRGVTHRYTTLAVHPI